MTPSPDLTMATIKMVLALVIVLALLWGLYRFSRRKMATQEDGASGAMIRIIENRYLGVKKSIALVQVPGALLVVGISADKMNLLSHIDDPDVLSTLDVNRHQRSQSSFLSLLQRVTNRQATSNTGSTTPDFGGSHRNNP